MSRRAAILARLQSNFGAVRPELALTLSDGSTYECVSDFEDRVFLWRTKPLGAAVLGAAAEPFFINLRDLENPKTRQGVPLGQHRHALEVDVHFPVRSGTAEATVRAILADLMAAVGADPKLGGLARWTDIEDDRLEVEQGGERIAGGGLTLRVTYDTALWRT